ncbi:hypothetical protein [Sphingorhabdus sp. 109]|uniref:hypothetical protein n=1 Tax=Sphingorhabdus sp. 109 TaxID=2653173 RepID=UPI0012EF2FD1|nr:hypothetical protein [Sphingorhabdus sp. 109]VWX56719.1 conserved hypothetical protein [Sphingorhabdus sp. 109]
MLQLMIGTSTSKTTPYSPPWLRDRKNPPTFHLRTASTLERDAFEAELEGVHNAGAVYDVVVREITIAGVRALAAEDDQGRLIDLLDQEAALDKGDELSTEEAALLRGLREVLSLHWPEYRAIQAQVSRRNKLLPTLAFMTFCSGWSDVTGNDGEPLKFATNALGQIDEDVLRRVPHIMLHVTGMQAYSMQYGSGEAKNSAPLSKSSGNQQTSTSGGGSTKGGKSPAKSGKKIPK